MKMARMLENGAVARWGEVVGGFSRSIISLCSSQQSYHVNPAAVVASDRVRGVI